MAFQKTEQQLQSNDCGVATIQIIYSIYGKHVNRDYLLQALHIDKKGSKLSDLKSFFDSNDFKSDYKLWDSNFEMSENGVSFILPIKNKKNHTFLVVKGKTPKKIKVYDPTSGSIYTSSYQQLKKIALCNRAIDTIDKVPTILEIKPKQENIENVREKDGNNKSIYWKLFKELSNQKKLWYIYLFIAFFSAFVTQLAVFINQILIDHILPSFNSKVLFIFSIGLGIYQLFNIFTSAYKRFIGIHLKNLLDQFFLQKFDSKINSFSLSYLQSFKKGDLIERVSDSMKLKRFFTKFFISVFIDLSISIYSLIILFFINWKLSFLILFILILFYFWFKFITPLLQHNERIRFVEKASFLSQIIEKIEAIQVIKSFGIEERQSQKTYKSIDSYLNIQLKNEYLNLLNTTVVSLIIGVMTIVVILSLSQYAIITKSISLGQIITFIALSTKIFSSFKSILNQNLTIQENQIILKRFFDFNEKKNEEITKKGISNFKIDSLEVKNVCFDYASNQNILNNINFTIKERQKIQIEGANGSGKSTLSKILTTLYNCNSGQILINNTLSSFYDPVVLNRKILLSTNEDILFNETILENICLGKDIDMLDIIKLSKEIGFYDFIASKKEGFNFMISNNGKNISTGQRKKIILLRALFSKAEIFILDEVLSGIDNESRKAIEQFIDRDNRTFIIISHEPIENISFSKKYKLKNGELFTV